MRLLYLHCKVQLFQLFDLSQSYWRLRAEKNWIKRDLRLLWRYFLDNPYRIYKKHAKRLGIDPYGYGETPLAVWIKIFEAVQLNPQDTFVDLGCGRGRGVLLASEVYGARALGVERIDIFVKLANKLRPTKAEFVCQDFEQFDLSGASVVYFYGLFYDDSKKQELQRLFATLERGAKVVSISFPLSEYLEQDNWEIVAKQEVKFAWGSTEFIIENKL